MVIASINELANMKSFNPMITNHNCKVIIVDEGDKKLRARNDKILSSTPHVYYGPRERREWFKQRLGLNFEECLSVIPEKCHAETSFGFLVAYEEMPDIVIELDDDVFPMQGHNLIDFHSANIFSDDGITVDSSGKWYNTIENLKLDGKSLFPRGHPYAKETRNDTYAWTKNGGACFLNMGLWAGNLDLDALTILSNQGLNGRYLVEDGLCKKRKVIVDEGTYFAICSMNTSFLPKIIPAFYQLYMNVIGVDRFDDIWSGIFIKKIMDHLGHKVCLGEPLIYHDKRPRDVFKDLKKELEGIIINEFLWKMIDKIELDGETYWDSYSSLTDCLEKLVKPLPNALHKKFMQIQIAKMKTWLKIIDKIA